MATFYFRPATGNWSAAGTWSDTSGGASNGNVPDATTDCVLDAGSGAFALTVDGTSGSPNLCKSLVCTGFTNTLTMGASAYIKMGEGQAAGNLTIVSGMTFSPNATATIEFMHTSGTSVITSGGKNMPKPIYSGAGGTWQYADNQTLASSAQPVTLTLGTLDTNSKTMTGIFSSTGTGTRALILGATSWTVGGSTTTGIVWDITDPTNMTLTCGTSTLTFPVTSAATQSWAMGGFTYNTVSCTGVTSGKVTILGANTHATLTLSRGSATTSEYLLGANQTVTGTFTSTGGSALNRGFIRSNTRGTQRTISAATVTCTNLDLQDIVGAGAGSWDLSAITGLSGDCGGNSSITFTTPANQYWVPSGGTSTGGESAVTFWSTSSGGTAGTGRSPLPQDTAIFDANSIDAGSRTITQDKPRIGTHNWTGATNTPAWTKSTVAMFFGSITLIAGMTQSGTSAYSYEGRGTDVLTTAGLTWTNPINVATSPSAGSLGFAANTTSSSTLTVTSGTLAQGTYTWNGTTTTLQGGTITGTGAITGSGAFTCSGTGVTGSALNCTISGNNVTINGTGSTFNLYNVVNSNNSITTTAGTVNLYGTYTANGATCFIVPAAGGGGGSYTFVG